jgi:hypothetical protein
VDTKEKARARRLQGFNLTIQDWERILLFQKGVCFICGQPSVGKRLSTDHSHEDGLVRGLLCHSCNAILGKIENAFKRYGLARAGLTVCDILARTIIFLKQPPAVEALGREVYGYPGRTGTKAFRKWLKNK